MSSSLNIVISGGGTGGHLFPAISIAEGLIKNNFSIVFIGSKFGIEKVPPLVGRGVVVNMAKYFGIAAMEGGQGITRDDIKNAAKQQNIKFKEGDYLVIPRGMIYTMKFDSSENRLFIVESYTPVYTPKRYRNHFGQLFHNP